MNVQQDMTLDEDIDIDGWEAGTSRVTSQPPSDQLRPGELGEGGLEGARLVRRCVLG